MNKSLRILIIDDHPMIAYGYELSLLNIVKENTLEIYKTYSIDDALEILKKNEENPFDIYLLDINMPPSKNLKILNGEDLGFKIQEYTKNSKIIVLTSLNNPTRIFSILHDLKPNGFLIKTKVTPEILLDAIDAVISGKNYFSEEIKKLIKPLNVKIDKLDRKILYFISIGEKMKNLPKFIPLSMASIERRKNKIKMQLNIPDCNDRELLSEARKRGHI